MLSHPFTTLNGKGSSSRLPTRKDIMSNTTDSTFPPGTFGPDGTILKSPWYDYLVNRDVAWTFVALFGATTVIHFIQALWFRMFWLLPTVFFGGCGECLAWAARLWSSFSPLNQTPYMIQIVAAILAPTPFLGSIFMIFRRVTQLLGTQYSRLSPRWYSRIFLTADVVALVVQGAGGGIAASSNTDSGTNLGANIMLGGIVFQLVCLVIFISISSEFFVRYAFDRPLPSKQGGAGAIRGEWGRKMKIFTAALVAIVFFLFVRSIYRILELADGWNGTIINTEWYFDVFDGAMVCAAMLTMNVFHPGWFMKLEPDDDDATVGETMVLQGMEPAYKDTPYVSDPYAAGTSSFSTTSGKEIASTSTSTAHLSSDYHADKRDITNMSYA